ncbi:RNA polymerase sigma factor [Chitinophaga sancti]|uniref:RNA polymerase sigma-70 factor, ECF subfamily n=1 Tax=Chitinophaga sancti TaxID=1004 RepID=A0A1K1PUS1_9BACT|nr:sigma-70 family RNA polymerase sigma factor [Chitinophaga sancti]WQD61607.1 sigma-70 family RNA polymerase sigma factor [Chitinophaga sancti]WQG92836.1 sigma-70 family RNA polymerase sigma factor [Chitinophaga sancti]SFW51359.1 RNA polymerase sigma-70 factor, ECF subfamily [Chitinophaga sancti]
MESAFTYTESELIQGLKAKDQKVFSYLYDRYSPALYGVALKVLNDESNASDCLQEVFMKIWRNIDRYDESKGRLFTWMLNITRNTAIDTLRSKAHKMDQKIQDIGDDVHLYTGNLAVHPSVDHLGLSKVLEKLTKEQRIIIDLAYYKGCTQEEISRLLEIPLGTVKTRMRNAIIQLRNLLKLV